MTSCVVRGNYAVLNESAAQRLGNALQYIPDVRQVAHAKGNATVVPFNLESWRLLTNAGIRVAAPISSQYDWAGSKPFANQKATAALLSTSPRAYDLSEMGVGKTRAAIYAADFLIRTTAARRVLIVAPLSTLVDVWRRELFEVVPDYSVEVLHGTRERRLKRLANPAHFYIINPEGVTTIKKDLMRHKWDIVIIDELAAYRNAQTVRWQALKSIVSGAAWAWGLTGSPTPNSPLDAYGQLMMLTPSRVPSSFRRFRNDLMTQITQFKWEPRPEAKQMVHSLMQPSIRFKRADCHDLPPLTYSSRSVDLSPAQKAAYDAMMKHCRVEMAAGRINAVNEGVKIGKLLQISAGFAYDSNGKAHWLGAPARIRELLDLIEQAERKVLVFSSHTWMTNILGKILNAAKVKTSVITGATTARARSEIFQDFRSANGARVISAHPGTMAHGLTLTEANTTIWYGPTSSPDHWNQANARTQRPSQTAHTHVICLQSSPVERRAFGRLHRKQTMEGLLLEMFTGGKDE